MPMTREEIEEARAAAMVARGQGGTAGGRAPGAMPNQSRLTLARAAIRPEMKGRVMLSGPAGAGKTYTAHVIATTLVGPDGRTLTIDTEKESSLTYADVFRFDQLRWNPPYDPTALSLTLKEAAASYDCIIVDSFSHFWRKQGGVLDIAGDNVRGWKAARPIQENLIETLLDVDCHVIVCCRSKMEHLIEDKGNGRITVTKAGIKAQQDDDLEYEVNVALELDMPHVLHIVKSRTNAVPVGAQFLAGLAGDFAQQYRDWLKSGEPVADQTQTDLLRVGLDEIADDGDRRRLKKLFLDTFGRPEFLLVSRLPEAQQWVVDAVAGRLPVERGEDDEPPEPAGTEGPGGMETHTAVGATEPGSGPESPSGPPAASTRQESRAGGTAERTAETPHPDSVESRVDLAGPAVFNGDTGHCDDCGAPVWYAADERDGGPGWLHAEAAEFGPEHEITGVTATMAEADELATKWREMYGPKPAAATSYGEGIVAEITAEVEAMDAFVVLETARAAGLPTNGSPTQLRARYLEHRLAEARAAEAR